LGLLDVFNLAYIFSIALENARTYFAFALTFDLVINSQYYINNLFDNVDNVLYMFFINPASASAFNLNKYIIYNL
jgi:hypothetical protein